MFALTLLASASGAKHTQILEDFHASAFEFPQTAFETLSAPSSACVTAYMAWSASNASCSYITAINDPGFDPLRANMTVHMYCSSSCRDDFLNKTVTFLDACFGDWSANNVTALRVRSFLSLLHTVCLFDAIEGYCFPRFKEIAAHAPGTMWDALTLWNLCGEGRCVAQVWNAYAMYAPTIQVGAVVGQILSVCRTDRNKTWCQIAQQQAQAAAAAQGPGFTTAGGFANGICSNCNRLAILGAKYFERIMGMPDDPNLDQIENNIDLFCIRNPAGDYCFDLIQSQSSQIMGAFNTCGAELHNGQCQGDCVSNLTTLTHSMGCCIGTALNFAAGNRSKADTIRGVIGKACNVGIPLGCGQMKLRAVLTFANLAFAFCNARPDCQMAALSDLAYAAGHEESLIQFVSHAATADGTGYVITFDIFPADGNATGALLDFYYLLPFFVFHQMYNFSNNPQALTNPVLPVYFPQATQLASTLPSGLSSAPTPASMMSTGAPVAASKSGAASLSLAFPLSLASLASLASLSLAILSFAYPPCN